MNPVPDGDIYWQPVNMMEMGAQPPESTSGARSDETVVRELTRDKDGQIIGSIERRLANPPRAGMYPPGSDDEDTAEPVPELEVEA